MTFDDGNCEDEVDKISDSEDEESSSDASKHTRRKVAPKNKGSRRKKATSTRKSDKKSSKGDAGSRRIKKASGTKIVARNWNTCAVPNSLEARSFLMPEV